VLLCRDSAFINIFLLTYRLIAVVFGQMSLVAWENAYGKQEYALAHRRHS
jgi:hypothetical protein